MADCLKHKMIPGSDPAARMNPCTCGPIPSLTREKIEDLLRLAELAEGDWGARSRNGSHLFLPCKGVLCALRMALRALDERPTLTEEERANIFAARAVYCRPGLELGGIPEVLAIIDRLTAAPETGETETP